MLTRVWNLLVARTFRCLTTVYMKPLFTVAGVRMELKLLPTRVPVNLLLEHSRPLPMVTFPIVAILTHRLTWLMKDIQLEVRLSDLMKAGRHPDRRLTPVMTLPKVLIKVRPRLALQLVALKPRLIQHRLKAPLTQAIA